MPCSARLRSPRTEIVISRAVDRKRSADRCERFFFDQLSQNLVFKEVIGFQIPKVPVKS